MHNIVEKHFSISIATVRSQGESLVNYKHIDGYNVKGQIIKSKITKNFKNLDITFLIFKQLSWLKNHMFYFFKWNLMLQFNLFQVEQAVFKAP
jgi:hypothetical protein